MATVLLIIHGVIAVFLIGAITHQFLATFWPRKPGETDFVANARGVRPRLYAPTVVLLYVITFCLGAYLYPTYRVFVRPPLQDLHLTYAIGLFEIKENFAAIGLALMPAYWFYWARSEDYLTARRVLTAVIFWIVWYNFLAGHILNNVRGFA